MSNLSADDDDFSDAYDFNNDNEQDAHMQDGKPSSVTQTSRKSPPVSVRNYALKLTHADSHAHSTATTDRLR